MKKFKFYILMSIGLLVTQVQGMENNVENLPLIPLEQSVVVENNHEENMLKQEEVITKTLEETPYFQYVPLGDIGLSDLKLQWEDKTYPLYYYNYSNFISTGTLRNLGLIVDEKENSMYIGYSEDHISGIQSSQKVDTSNKGQLAYMNNKRIYVGNCLTYSLKVGEEYLIPIRSLGDLFNFRIEGGNCYLEKVEGSTADYVQLQGNSIVNKTDKKVDVKVLDVYINNEGERIEEVKEIQLNPREEEKTGYTGQGMHIGSLVTEVRAFDEFDLIQSTIGVNMGMYGQDIVTWEKIYNENKVIYDKEALAAIFPESKIIATMKYATGGFKKGEKVEVARAQDGYYYYVWRGKEQVRIPWNSLSVPPNPEVCKKRATTQQIEAYINQQNLTSQTSYLVWTDLYRQRTYVFTKEGGLWKLHRDLLSSTGKNITPTPRGIYKLQAYVPYFGLNKGYMCKDAIQISGDYLYHSLMMDTTGSYVLERNGALGERRSQGCIRFSVEDANWFYNTLPLKTTVWIN